MNQKKVTWSAAGHHGCGGQNLHTSPAVGGRVLRLQLRGPRGNRRPLPRELLLLLCVLLRDKQLIVSTSDAPQHLRGRATSTNSTVFIVFAFQMTRRKESFRRQQAEKSWPSGILLAVPTLSGWGGGVG